MISIIKVKYKKIIMKMIIRLNMRNIKIMQGKIKKKKKLLKGKLRNNIQSKTSKYSLQIEINKKKDN